MPDFATINDIIVAVQASKVASMEAQQSLAEVTRALGRAMRYVGSVFVLNSDGSVIVYEEDGHGGYVVKVPKPASTPVPV